LNNDLQIGYYIKPYSSIENAINTWPATATAIDIKLENEKFKIYASFGLNDLFGINFISCKFIPK